MKIREAKKGEIVPKMMRKGGEKTECDPIFFIVKLSWGSPKSNEFAYIKRSRFPFENEKKPPTVIFLLCHFNSWVLGQRIERVYD